MANYYVNFSGKKAKINKFTPEEARHAGGAPTPKDAMEDSVLYFLTTMDNWIEAEKKYANDPLNAYTQFVIDNCTESLEKLLILIEKS